MVRLDLRKKIVFSAFLALLSLGSYAQDTTKVAKQKFIVDEVVAVVGSSMILLSDLNMAEQYIMQDYIRRGYTGKNARGEALESLLLQKLLVTQAAKDSLPIADAMVEQMADKRLKELVASRGSAAKLEEYYRKPIFAIKDILKTKMREDEMASSMQQSIRANVSATPSETKSFFKTINKDSLPIVPEQYVYAKIAVLPSKDDDRKLDVKENLLDIRSRILEGTSFGALARMYSDDIGSAMRGGELEPAPSSSYVTGFKEAVESAEIGKLTGVVESEYGYHIIEVLGKKDGIYRLRHILLKVKFDPTDKAAAVVLLDSVANQIKIDSLDFEEAVARFSQDKGSMVGKGLVINSQYESYGAKYKSTRFFKEELGPLYDRISTLKPGDISMAFEHTDNRMEESVQIIKLLEIVPAHPASIEDDYSTIVDMAVADKQQKKFDKWLEDKMEEIYINIEESYRDIPLTNEKWKK